VGLEGESEGMVASALVLVALLEAADSSVSQLGVEGPKPNTVGLGANIGLFVNKFGVATHARISGEFTLYSRPLNDLVALIQVGSGMAISFPSDSVFKEHYQHVAMAGFGYRSNHDLISWGFQLALGAVWYRTSFKPGPYLFESTVTVYSEGRAQFGIKLATSFRMGVYVGYGSPLYYPLLHPGSLFVGGFMFGLYADFR